MRITPELITELAGTDVFVFGSNLGGFHGAGAAKQAMNWGAEWGNPVGHQGQTYAIPTKTKDVKDTLSVEEIKPFVDEFIAYAKAHTILDFYVTKIGCGLADRTYPEMGPLFIEALDVDNIYLPQNFIDYAK